MIYIVFVVLYGWFKVDVYMFVYVFCEGWDSIMLEVIVG